MGARESGVAGRRARGASRSAALRGAWPVAVSVMVVLAGCSSAPVLLPEDEFDDVTIVEHDTKYSIAPGWTWCRAMSPVEYGGDPDRGTWLEIDGGPSVGATVLDQSGIGEDSAGLVAEFVADADQCTLSAATIGTGRSIEPLDGQGDGVTAWRTEDPNGVWGEFAVLPLDDTRVLAVGFQTDRDEAPAELEDLISLARQRATTDG